MSQQIKSTVWQFRSFVEWVKTVLIQVLVTRDSDGPDVVQLCCGDGVDCGKLARALPRSVTFVEPDADKLAQTKRRWEERVAAAAGDDQQAALAAVETQFVAGGFDLLVEQSVLNQRAPSCDVLFCFDGLPHQFATEARARAAMRALAAVVRPGGYVAGIMPDAASIWSLAQKTLVAQDAAAHKSGSGSGTAAAAAAAAAGPGSESVVPGLIESSLFSIGFEHGQLSGFQPFGTQYAFRTDDGRQEHHYLVHSPSFVRLAHEAGFEVTDYSNFLEFFEDNKRNHYDSLRKVGVVGKKPQQLAIQQYVTKMASEAAGMKVLLLDEETVKIVSLAFSQSEIMQKEVYLFERLDNDNREAMLHLNALCLVRPTEANVRLLEAELHAPKYGHYHFYFTNVVRGNLLEELAQADEHEVVDRVQEFYADFYPLTPNLFSLNLLGVPASIRHPLWRDVQSRRCSEGLLAVLLALKKQPEIRYAAGSDVAQQLAQDISKRIQQEQKLFSFRVPELAPVLLILDRKDDPVTPLLHQWTYQAMVHELIGIHGNRVDLSNAPGVRKDQQQIVLSTEQDPFFKENLYLNFGDLGVAIKDLLEEYQKKTKTSEKMDSIADIKRFVEEFPEFRKLAGNASKHVALLSELSRIIDSRSLMPVSELEQELSVKQDHNTAKTNVLEFIRRPDLNNDDKLKLVLLYSLRYEDNSSNIVTELLDELSAQGLDHGKIQTISKMTRYAGLSRRSSDLFSNKNILGLVKNSLRRGVKGAVNVYTEHTPPLLTHLEALSRGKLKETEFPFALGQTTKERPKDVIVFVVGGATYEEALAVHEFSKANSGIRVVLGGTCVHNSESFLNAIRDLE